MKKRSSKSQAGSVHYLTREFINVNKPVRDFSEADLDVVIQLLQLNPGTTTE